MINQVAAETDSDADGGRRTQILDAALHVMSEHGFRGASIKRIAERAGLKSPALIGAVTADSVDLATVARRFKASGLLTDEALVKITALNAVAQRRGQTLAQMALAWALRDQRVTSALIGASSVQQLEDSLGALEKLEFAPEELEEIDRYASDAGINLWARSSEA